MPNEPTRIDGSGSGSARKLVLLVYGAGSGLGKSTIASALTHRIESRGLSVQLLTEEWTTEAPAFRSYVEQVQNNNAANTATLLECCDRFITELSRADADVVVLDSILPCWDWLYSAGATDEVVFGFTCELVAMLGRLLPALALVEGDLDQALQRAIQERGMEWALDLAERRTGHRDQNALRAYFHRLREGTDRAVSRWNFPMVRVDTVNQTLESAVRFTTAEFAEWLQFPVLP